MDSVSSDDSVFTGEFDSLSYDTQYFLIASVEGLNVVSGEFEKKFSEVLSFTTDKVSDTTAPVLSSTSQSFTTTVGTALAFKNVTANDAVDGVVSVVITSNVNFNAVGTYTRTYTATDNAGNSSSVTHTYVVNAAPVTPPPAVNSAPTWTASSYNTGLTVRDLDNNSITIKNLTALSSDNESDTITYSIVSISVPSSFDQNDWDNATFIESGVLKVKNLMAVNPHWDGTVTVTVKATATRGSNNTNISFEYNDFQ